MGEVIPCPHCGQVLRADAASCSACGATVDDPAAVAGVAAFDAPAADSPLIPPPPPLPAPGAVGDEPLTRVGDWAVTPTQPPILRRVRRLATASQVALGLMGALALAEVGARFMERSLLQKVDDEGLMFGLDDQLFNDLVASDDRLAALAGLWIVGIAVTGVIFIVWYFRMYTNLEPLGADTLPHTKPLAGFGWVIPIANLVIPFQVLKAVWTGLDPERVDFPREWWKNKKAPGLLSLWWILLVVGNWLSFFSESSMTDAVMSFNTEKMLNANTRLIAADVMLAGAAVLGIFVVRRWTDRQLAVATARGTTV